jgi:hypothetical protein
MTTATGRIAELQANNPPKPEQPPPTHWDVQLHSQRHDYDSDCHEPAGWPDQANPVPADAPLRDGYQRMTTEELIALKRSLQPAYDEWALEQRLVEAKAARIRIVDATTQTLIPKYLKDLEKLDKLTEDLEARINAAKTVEELEAVTDDR